MTADHGPLCPNGVRCPDCGWPIPPEHDAAIAARARARTLRTVSAHLRNAHEDDEAARCILEWAEQVNP